MSPMTVGDIIRGSTWKDDPGRLKYNAEKEAGQ